MRTRVVVRSVNALVQRARLLNPFRAGVLRPPTLESQGFALPRARAAYRGLSVERLAGDPTTSGRRSTSGSSPAVLRMWPCRPCTCSAGGSTSGPVCLSAPFYFVLANAARSGV